MCSHHRQTMLFSATMTDEVGLRNSAWWGERRGAEDPAWAAAGGLGQTWLASTASSSPHLPASWQASEHSCLCAGQVKDLASVSLKNPVRIFVNSNTDVAPFLRQEFVRIRPNREGDREAIVAGESPGCQIPLALWVAHSSGGVFPDTSSLRIPRPVAWYLFIYLLCHVGHRSFLPFFCHLTSFLLSSPLSVLLNT